MSQFRKKPVVIDATQWFKNGDHPLDYAKERQGFERGQVRVWQGEEAKAMEWEGDVVRYFRRPDVDGAQACQHCAKPMNDHGWIDTLEGGHIVCPGDWVITGVKGEVYPCKPDIFAATYEVEAPEKPLVNAAALSQGAFIEGGWDGLRSHLDPPPDEAAAEMFRAFFFGGAGYVFTLLVSAGLQGDELARRQAILASELDEFRRGV